VTRVAGFLFLATILVSPVPFGAIQAWAWGPMVIVLGLAATAFACSKEMKAFVNEWHARLGLPLLGFGAVLLWIFVQGELFSALAPGSGARSGSSLIADVPDSLFRILAYGLVFILAVALGRSRTFAEVAMRLFALGGLLVALYAVFSWQLTPERLLWTRKEIYHGFATGTFLNRNTFATYAGLVLITITAIILAQRPRAENVSGPGFARRFVPYFVMQLERNWFWILAWIVVVFALLLSGSRAGTLSTAAAMISLLLLMGRSKAGDVPSRHRWMRRLKAPAIAVFGMLAVYFAGGDVLAARIWEGGLAAQASERLELSEVALRALADSPWTGTGLGTFPQIFAIYRPPHLTLQPGSEFVHNSFLEVTLGLGVPAALVFYAVLAYCAYQCFRGVRRRRRGRVFPALAAAATILAAMHSLVDFSLEIPAVAMAYAFLLGLGFGQAWRRDLARGEWIDANVRFGDL